MNPPAVLWRAGYSLNLSAARVWRCILRRARYDHITPLVKKLYTHILRFNFLLFAVTMEKLGVCYRARYQLKFCVFCVNSLNPPTARE